MRAVFNNIFLTYARRARWAPFARVDIYDNTLGEALFIPYCPIISAAISFALCELVMES